MDLSGGGEAEAPEGGGGGGIDWDFDVAGGGGGVDWGVEVAASGGEAEVSASPDPVGGIDWGAITFEGLEVRADGAGEEDDVAAGSFLNDTQARELLYQEVAEAGAFLEARRAELAGGSAGQGGGPEGAEKSLAEVEEMAKLTAKAEDLLAGRKAQRLLLLRSSERHMEQQVTRVEMALAQCGKPVAQRAALEKVKAEQAEEVKRTRAEMDRLREATHKARKALEVELGAHFKATVRITGEILQI